MKSMHKSINQWAEDDRPREKLLKHGKQTLSNAELLAILLGSGSRECSAVDLAKQILDYYNNDLNCLCRASAEELCKNFKGVGKAKAVSILAAMELAVRKSNTVTEQMQIKDTQTAFQVFSPYLSDLSHEEFWVALLTNANRVISLKRVSMGGLKETVVDKKILLKLVIDNLASAIIIAHNHPSGNPKISAEDKVVTQKVKNLCEILDVQLLDHIIVCGNTYVSFADEGLL